MRSAGTITSARSSLNLYIRIRCEIQRELKDILNIQLQDNVKARWLDNELNNEYVRTSKRKVRSQVETYNYLFKKNLNAIETGSN